MASSRKKLDDIVKVCSVSSNEPRRLWNQSVWEKMQDTYRETVGENASTIDLLHTSGLHDAVKAQQSPGKGRGIFATKKIKKGEIVWKDHQHATFTTEQDFKKFLLALSSDELACDILMWSYVEIDDDEKDYVAAVELDEGSFMNDISGNTEQLNVGYCKPGSDFQKNSGCDAEEGEDWSYATRDIESGEEILTNYGKFDNDGKLMWWDDLWWKTVGVAEGSDSEETSIVQDCWNYDENERPVWNETTLKILEDAASSALGKKLLLLAPMSQLGLHANIEARKTKRYRRGIFATTKIKKGEEIYNDNRRVIFHREQDFRNFLSSLPDVLVCDVLMWANVQNCVNDEDDDDEDGDDQSSSEEECTMVALSLDEGAFLQTTSDIMVLSNVGDCKPGSDIQKSTGCEYGDRVYATRTIEQGEQIFSNYVSDFSDTSWFTHLREQAWNKCYSTNERRIWNQSTWYELQDKYIEAVGTTASSIASLHNSGLHDFIKAQQSQGKGRGLFATKKIKKGEIIWKNTKHAIFHHEQDFKKFLSSLSDELACDVLMWAYVESYDDDESNSGDNKEHYVASVELDEGSYMNSVSGDSEQPNIGYCEPGSAFQKSIGCDSILGEEWSYATRDIEPGEEILTDYTNFDNNGRLVWFDDLVDGDVVDWIIHDERAQQSSNSKLRTKVAAERSPSKMKPTNGSKIGYMALLTAVTLIWRKRVFRKSLPYIQKNA